jgi:hypothetical protein
MLKTSTALTIPNSQTAQCCSPKFKFLTLLLKFAIQKKNEMSCPLRNKGHIIREEVQICYSDPRYRALPEG